MPQTSKQIRKTKDNVLLGFTVQRMDDCKYNELAPTIFNQSSHVNIDE